MSAAPPSLRNEDAVLCSPTKAVVYAKKKWLRGKTVNQLSLTDTVSSMLEQDPMLHVSRSVSVPAVTTGLWAGLI